MARRFEELERNNIQPKEDGKYKVGLDSDRLTSTGLSVKEIAYSLGYEYPQYFVRMFRQQTGQTPTQYRSIN